MMKRNILLITLISGLLACSAFAGIFGWGDDEEDVALKDLPATIVKTIARVFPKGVLKKAEKGDKDKAAVYEVKVADAKTLYEVKLTAEGKLIQIKVDDDEVDDMEEDNHDEQGNKMSAEDLPPVVQSAVLKVFPKGKIEDVDRGQKTKAVVYKVEIEDGDLDHVVIVNEKGKVLRITKGSDAENDDKDGEREEDDEHEGHGEDRE